MRRVGKRLFYYLLQGLLYTLPIGALVVLVLWAVRFTDGLVPIGIPGLGILIIIGSLILIGWLFSGLAGAFVLEFIDGMLMRIPFLKFIYGSAKDLTEAVVGDKKKFSEPVAVQVEKDHLYLLAFITRKDVQLIDKPGMIVVYMPTAYSIAGNTLLVSTDRVIPLHASSGEIMKLIVSGGLTGNIKSGGFTGGEGA